MCYTEKLQHREVQLSSLLDYIKDLEAWRLGGYQGDDVEYILHLLQHSHPGIGNGVGAGNAANFTVLGGGQKSSRDGSGTMSHPATRTDSAGSRTSWKERRNGTGATLNADESPNSDLAHALHYASIALLGLLVIEVRTTLTHTPSFPFVVDLPYMANPQQVEIVEFGS